MAHIYKIINVVTDSFYVGSAVNVKRRRWEHFSQLKRGEHHCVALQAAWNEFGEDAFEFEILEEVPDDKALQIEDTYLAQHAGRPYCYNTACTTMQSVSSSPAVREKIRQSILALYKGRGYHPRLGKHHSEETRQKISENRKGKMAGAKHYRYGKTVSDETRAKISAAQKGRPNKRKGMKMSEQGRANVAAAVKRGADSHFFGKRPSNADANKRRLICILPDRSTREYSSLKALMEDRGVTTALIRRACLSGKPIAYGKCGGWVISYADSEKNEPPAIPDAFKGLPHTRADALQLGVPTYFTGLACIRGHIDARSVKGACLSCQREDQRKYNAKRK